MNGFLTTGQFAKSLGVHRRTIERARNAGKMLPAHYTPGGQARYAPQQVEQYKCQEKNVKSPGSTGATAQPTPAGTTPQPAELDDFRSVQTMLARRKAVSRPSSN